ncbi:Uncharacterized protein ACMD2_05105 [Ananas comosus]|uniref:Uncharacterized protein n=1 Tax=Ananas comosus TaxID=4615 RepID=A0A199UKY7_ANACO|nr:Uncharacterized protein ACMD2_05105 [Ananas comosus]
MAGEEERRKRVESLGWLTESAVMPKKHKAIEGVGASSIVELKAQLYRTQEEARKAKDSSAASADEFHRARKKPLPSDLFSQKNSGVESRARSGKDRVLLGELQFLEPNKHFGFIIRIWDKLEMKAIKDGSVSYAALEKKVEIYEKLARGELPDEEEKEKYCVDFFRKGLEQDEPQQPELHGNTSDDVVENQDGDTDDSLLNSKLFGLGRASAIIDNDEHKRFVREVHEEASQAREKATTLRARRQEQEAARREKLRQAYLKKQLDKLISSKQTAAISNNNKPIVETEGVGPK